MGKIVSIFSVLRYNIDDIADGSLALFKIGKAQSDGPRLEGIDNRCLFPKILFELGSEKNFIPAG